MKSLRRVRFTYFLLLSLWTLNLAVSWRGGGEERASSCTPGRKRRLENVDVSRPSAPGFYDDLRLNSSVILGTPITTNSSAVYQVTTIPQGNTPSQTYRLAEFKAFLPFSNDGENILQATTLNSLAILLAIYHFNNVEFSPFLTTDHVANCPDLRITVEFLDSFFTAIEAARNMASVLLRNKSFELPPAAAVIGAVRSTVTAPLGILAGANGIPHINAVSTATDFDDKSVYPLFGRTVTNTDGEAAVAVKFFQSIEATHVCVLFITDLWGSSLQKSFQDAAALAGIATQSVAVDFLVEKESDDLIAALQLLQAMEYRHIYAVLDETQFDAVMSSAADMGLVGRGYVWTFPGVSEFFLRNRRIVANSPLVLPFDGTAYLHMQGGIIQDKFLAGNYTPPPLQEHPESGFEKFRAAWSQSLGNVEFVEYVQTKYPKSLGSVSGFDPNAPIYVSPGVYSPFHYDAITSFALSMCNAVPFFNATEVYDNFLLELGYSGATGNVVIDSAGTADYTTITFALWNPRVIGVDEEGFAIIEVVPVQYFEVDQFVQIADHTFVFAGGSTDPPDSLPADLYDNNYIGSTGRIVGYTLVGITMALTVVSVGWMYYYRTQAVVVAAQPRFLSMVSLGVFISVSTIIPLGMEEPVVLTLHALGIACMSAPWLYFVGISFTLSALLAKMKGVYNVWTNPNLDFIFVSSCDLLLIFLIYFLVNFVVLIVWTTVSPLHWTRTALPNTDIYDRRLETAAFCDGSHAVVYFAVLGLINFVVLLLGNYWAYRSRNIETEYNESSYVGVTFAAVLQAWAMGVPILFVVWHDPEARFYVYVGIIVSTSLAILGLIYVPKMIILRRLLKEANDPKKLAYYSYLERSRESRFDDDEPENAVGTFRIGGVCTSLNSICESKEEDAEESDHIENEHRPKEPLEMSEDTKPSLATHSNSHGSDYYSSDVLGHTYRDSLSDTFVVEQRRENIRESDRELTVSWGRHARSSEARRSGDSRYGSGNDSPTRSGMIASLRKAGAALSRVMAARETNSSEGGVKVLHNPRAIHNLELSGGVEMSRAQLGFLIDLNDDASSDDSVEGKTRDKGLSPVSEEDYVESEIEDAEASK